MQKCSESHEAEQEAASRARAKWRHENFSASAEHCPASAAANATATANAAVSCDPWGLGWVTRHGLVNLPRWLRLRLRVAAAAAAVVAGVAHAWCDTCGQLLGRACARKTGLIGTARRPWACLSCGWHEIVVLKGGGTGCAHRPTHWVSACRLRNSEAGALAVVAWVSAQRPGWKPC